MFFDEFEPDPPLSEIVERRYLLVSTAVVAFFMIVNPLHDAPFLFLGSWTMHTRAADIIMVPVLYGFIVMSGLVRGLMLIRLKQPTSVFVTNLIIVLLGLLGTIGFVYRCLHINW